MADHPRTDLAPVRRMLRMPAEVTEVTWTARPRGRVGLGPTDTEALVWIPGMTGQAGTPADVEVPTDMLAKLAPVRAGSERTTRLSGSAVPSVTAASGWDVVGAVGVEDGAFVYVSSR